VRIDAPNLAERLHDRHMMEAAALVLSPRDVLREHILIEG